MKEQNLPELPEPDIVVTDTGTAWNAAINPEIEGAGYYSKEQVLSAIAADRAKRAHGMSLTDEQIKAAADRMWRAHPSYLQDQGITRQEFYAQEIRALLADASLHVANAPQVQTTEEHRALQQEMLERGIENMRKNANNSGMDLT